MDVIVIPRPFDPVEHGRITEIDLKTFLTPEVQWLLKLPSASKIREVDF